MAGCDAIKREQCRQIGKTCKKGRCVNYKDQASRAKRARSSSPGPSRASKIPRRAVEDAILANVGPATAMSLDNGYSSKLQAGMGTMVDMTRSKLRKMPTRRTNSPSNILLDTYRRGFADRAFERGVTAATKPGKTSRKSTGPKMTKAQKAWAAKRNAGNLLRRVPRKSSGQRKTRAAKPAKPCPPGTTRSSTTGRCKKYARGGGGARNRRVNWSGNGLPMGCRACANPARPVQDTKTCKCYAMGSDAARKLGICKPTKLVINKKTGISKIVPLVYAKIDGKHRCVAAGGSTAKKTLKDDRACPPGKIMKTVRKYSPATGKYIDAKQCVKPKGMEKQCKVGQVLVSVPSSGVVPAKDGRPAKRWSKNIVKCVTAKTAAQKGYFVLRQGTAPPPRARLSRSASFPAMSMGF